jgi:cyanate lyase
MSSSPIILGKRDLLNAIGTALLQAKCERRLTLNEMAETLGRSDEMLAQYIAGEAEMGVTAWLRAIDAWPEIADKLNGNGK